MWTTIPTLWPVSADQPLTLVPQPPTQPDPGTVGGAARDDHTGRDAPPVRPGWEWIGGESEYAAWCRTDGGVRALTRARLAWGAADIYPRDAR